MEKEAFFGNLFKTVRQTASHIADPAIPSVIREVSKDGDIIHKGLSNIGLIRLSLPALGATAAYQGGQEVAEAISRKIQTGKSKESLKEDPDIARADRNKAEALFNTLKQYAPNIAKDPLIAQHFVKGMLQYGTVDHNVASDLMVAEKVYQELKGKPFTALQAVKGVSWLA